MLDRFLGQLHNTRYGSPTLRAYLWWGLTVRGVLLFAMGTLLLVKGNFLADWLLALRLPFVPSTDVEELSAISYGVVFVLLAVGGAARWGLLRRLDATDESPPAPPSSDDEPGVDERTEQDG